MKNNLTFNDFCIKQCDRLYTPGLDDSKQSTGYIFLKKMVQEQIKPASLKEIKRWEDNPTEKELIEIPEIKYMRFLHPLLRPYIINNWDYIKTLKL